MSSSPRGYGSRKLKPSFSCALTTYYEFTSSLTDSVALDVDDLLPSTKCSNVTIQTVSKAMSCWQRKSQLYASSQSRQLCSNLPVPRLCQLHGRLIPRSATLLAQLRILISALGKNKRLKLTEYVVKAFEEGALLSLVDYVAGATSSSSDHSSLSPPSTSTCRLRME
ncbi:hypothetical protein T4C_1619 [Trichinella pseudospiralis]|uniref:Uncharacterized protein n=1 Tax=Trichinella pseudospiralis TaxID=6337 RepID=A0A0V1JC54_TRIPS|nr:hypothetical protein T4C_1619 [Trichinella pseudospiralis]